MSKVRMTDDTRKRIYLRTHVHCHPDTMTSAPTLTHHIPTQELASHGKKEE